MNLAIRGMTCAACVARVERALSKVPGVLQAQVNYATETAAVTLAADASIPADALQCAVEKAGYEAHVQAADVVLEDAHQSWWQIWGAVTLGLLASLPLVLPMLLGQHDFWPAWVQFALATPVQFGLGWRFYKAGWAALRAGSGNMDQLVALGTSAAYGLSCWLWMTHDATMAGMHGGGMPLYFESAAVVITLVLLGKALGTPSSQLRFFYSDRGKPALAGLHELLRPGVIQALGDAFLAAQLGNAVFAAQAIQHDADLVLGRKVPSGLPPDVLHHPLRRGLGKRFCIGGFGLHLRSFVTTTKPKSSLNRNLKSVPLVLTGNSRSGRVQGR